MVQQNDPGSASSIPGDASAICAILGAQESKLAIKEKGMVYFPSPINHGDTNESWVSVSLCMQTGEEVNFPPNVLPLDIAGTAEKMRPASFLCLGESMC